jgi:hypothetical protein
MVARLLAMTRSERPHDAAYSLRDAVIRHGKSWIGGNASA